MTGPSPESSARPVSIRVMIVWNLIYLPITAITAVSNAGTEEGFQRIFDGTLTG